VWFILRWLTSPQVASKLWYVSKFYFSKLWSVSMTKLVAATDWELRNVFYLPFNRWSNDKGPSTDIFFCLSLPFSIFNLVSCFVCLLILIWHYLNSNLCHRAICWMPPHLVIWSAYLCLWIHLSFKRFKIEFSVKYCYCLAIAA
jgi:hypothetical protein